jgi:hypothetical protein
MDWIDLAQDKETFKRAFVNTVMRVPVAIKFCEIRAGILFKKPLVGLVIYM